MSVALATESLESNDVEWLCVFKPCLGTFLFVLGRFKAHKTKVSLL